MYNLALDRMENIEVNESHQYIDKDLDGDEYFKDIVGVTVSEGIVPKNVIFGSIQEMLLMSKPSRCIKARRLSVKIRMERYLKYVFRSILSWKGCCWDSEIL